MPRTRELVCLAIAAAAGAGAWLLVADRAGRREAWDSSLYYYTVIPAVAVVTGILGYGLRGRAIALGLAGGVGQLVAMLVRSGLGNLWPIGCLIMVVLSIPSMITAWLGARLARASRPGTD